MSIVVLDTKWHGLLDPQWIQRLDETPFLTRCRKGWIQREELRDFIVQQHFYSRHFTRFLCALLSNITNENDRLELTQNLLEEIGFGGNGQLPHAQIYRNMMKQMDIDPSHHEVRPATQRLIEQMMVACQDPNSMVGLGALCLAAEAIVPHLYSQIVEGFRSVQEPETHLEFFQIHIEGDDAHAVTMLKIIERELQFDPQQRNILRNTARRLLEARSHFFGALTSNPLRNMAQMPGGIFYEQLLV